MFKLSQNFRYTIASTIVWGIERNVYLISELYFEYYHHSILNLSFFSVLLSTLRDASNPKSVSNYELRYPTLTNDVAVVCRQMIEHYKQTPSFKGIYHWQGRDQLTKYQMVKIMSKVLNLPMTHITPSNTPTSSTTPRPYHCQLDCTDLESLGIGQRTSFEDGIGKILAKFLWVGLID